MAAIKKKTIGNTSTDNYEILGGKAQIFRVAKSGDVWQFKMWVKEEQKYLRKSLRTRDFDTAVIRAEEKYLKTYSDVSSGRKIFGMSLGELVTEFIAWRADDVDAGIITKGRLGTIKSQFKHVTNFKSEKLKISELDRNSFYDYEVWRKKNFIGTGGFQESCRLKLKSYAATSFCFSGLRNTSSTLSQFRISPLQRSGCRDFAC